MMKPDFTSSEIFIRNLPFDANSEDLLSLFQELGPIRRAAIAEENGSSKGFGFVKFALDEDASKALREFQNHPFKGRKLKLELAVKSKKGELSSKRKNDVILESKNLVEIAEATATDTAGTKLVAKKLRSAPSSSSVSTISSVHVESTSIEDTASTLNKEAVKLSKPPSLPQSLIEKASNTLDVRTSRSLKLIAFGLPDSVKKKDFKYVTSKACRKVEITTITKDHDLYSLTDALAPIGKRFALIVPSRKNIVKLTELFSKSTEKTFLDCITAGSKSKSTIKPSQSSERAHTSNKRLFLRSLADLTEPILRRKKCRLIIRNLSFQATEINILDKFSQFGPISDVSIPKTEVVKKASSRSEKKDVTTSSSIVGAGNDGIIKLQPRGFGFITFLCEKDAKAAILGSVGLKICNREVAVDNCESKQAYSNLMSNQEDISDLNGKNEKAHKSVSAHLNLDKQITDARHGDGDDLDDNRDSDDGANNNNDDHDIDDDHDLDDTNDVGDEDDENIDSGIDNVGANEVVLSSIDDTDAISEQGTIKTNPLQCREPAKSNDVSEGRTVFLRELAFDATEADIKSSLRHFGRIQLAILVKDKDTGLSKGKAFVKFSRPHEAQLCVDTVTSQRGSVLIRDREFRADLAVDKNDVQNIVENRKIKRPVDKRNLYLANEGLVVEGGSSKSVGKSKDSRPSHGLTALDIERRNNAQMDKRRKLTNPLFLVSSTRLSVRQLPKTLGDHDLKIMCLKAAKAGMKKNLVSSSDVEAQLRAQGVLNASDSNPHSNKNKSSPTAVPELTKDAISSAKVMLDLTKLKNGVPQSKRFGFVEFKEHVHALACLRELAVTKDVVPYLPPLQRQLLESNPTAQAQLRDRLIVEFSVENINKVRLLQKRAENNQNKKRVKALKPDDSSMGRVTRNRGKRPHDNSDQISNTAHATYSTEVGYAGNTNEMIDVKNYEDTASDDAKSRKKQKLESRKQTANAHRKAALKKRHSKLEKRAERKKVVAKPEPTKT